MKITYDPDVNAAYIQIVPTILPGQASEQIHSIATPGGKGELILDFNSNGELLGVEVLNAKDVLPSSVLADAEPPATT